MRERVDPAGSPQGTTAASAWANGPPRVERPLACPCVSCGTEGACGDGLAQQSIAFECWQWLVSVDCEGAQWRSTAEAGGAQTSSGLAATTIATTTLTMRRQPV